MYPKYIKKEDVRDYYKNRQITLGSMVIAIAVAVGMLSFFVTPRLLEIYSDFEVPLSSIALLTQQIIPYLLVLTFAYGSYLLFFHPKDSFIESKLSLYKTGEMINVKLLSSHKEEIIIFFTFIFLLVTIIVGTISPIFNVLSSA